MYSTTIRKIYFKTKNVSVGYGSYGGCFLSPIPPNVTFGNYCSISQNIRVFRANHPLNEFTSHPILYNPIAGFVKNDQLKRPKLNIGHDVWIGEFSIILPSVSNIGNGAVIGAGSVVTKDVPAYSVVAGNPAKLIKMRFNKEIIKKIEDSKWWDLDKSQLTSEIQKYRSLVNE